MVLRCHLGLSVPPDCWLHVGDFKKTWENGKTLVFDDTYIHSAVNNSDQPRVILLLDFGVGVPVDKHESDSEEVIHKRKLAVKEIRRMISIRKSIWISSLRLTDLVKQNSKIVQY
jgi:hypothetical protein